MGSSMKLWARLYKVASWSYELTAASFRFQGLNWVDRRCAARRHVACEASRCEEYREYCDVGANIQRADAEQQRRHESRQCERNGKAGEDSGAGKRQAVPQKHPHQSHGFGTESEPDSDLSRLLRDDI